MHALVYSCTLTPRARVFQAVYFCCSGIVSSSTFFLLFEFENRLGPRRDVVCFINSNIIVLDGAHEQTGASCFICRNLAYRGSGNEEISASPLYFRVKLDLCVCDME